MAALRKQLDKITHHAHHAPVTAALRHPEWLFIREPENAWTETYRADADLTRSDYAPATFYDRPDLLVAAEAASTDSARPPSPTPRGLEEIVIPHPNPQGLWYGPSQDWYTDVWQQRSGCGPTSAAMITAYLARSSQIPRAPQLYTGATDMAKLHEAGPADPTVLTLDDMVAHMGTLWKYVTPTPMGTWKLSMYADGITDFARTCGVELQAEPLLVRPAFPARRPEHLYTTLRDHIFASLERDMPVPFLNYFGGEMRDISNWHWVTVTAARQTEDGEFTWLTVTDQGMQVDFSLNRWLYTSFGGGGFVHLNLMAKVS